MSAVPPQRSGGRGSGPPTGRRVNSGLATLDPDPDRPRAWTLRVDGIAHSHVDLDDPSWLGFAYMRQMADVLECTVRAGQPVQVLHLGGGGWSLARYVAATRPGSRHLLVDTDAALTAFVAEALPAGRGRHIRTHTADAREAVRELATGSVDVVFTDVFAGPLVPAHLTTVEFLADVARVLRPAGLHVMNLADGKPLAFSRSVSVGFREVFAETAVLCDPGILRGRRWGNVVLAGTDARWDGAALARRCASAAAPVRLLAGADVVRFGSGHPVPRDQAPLVPPSPPRDVLGLDGSR